MAAALRSLQKLSSLGVAAAATTLSYSGNKPSACDQRRRFEGKTIVITGGGGTFGRVGAKYFADQGAKVVLVDVNQAALDQVKVDGVTTCACDVRDPNQVQAVVDAAGTAAASPTAAGTHARPSRAPFYPLICTRTSSGPSTQRASSATSPCVIPPRDPPSSPAPISSSAPRALTLTLTRTRTRTDRS